MRVAFLGLGTMGRHMARNLVQGSHEVTVWNRTAGRGDELAALGARVVDSPRKAADGADVIGLSLSTSEVVRDVVLGDDGALTNAGSGSVIADFSTISQAVSREIGERCGERGVAWLDAPVSGGPEGAAAGTLTIMVGGDAVAFERATPVLQSVGRNIRHVGPSGAGLGIKLINQMFVGVNLAAVLEAWVMAERAGIDPDVMFDVLKSSAGSSVMLTRNVPDFLMKGHHEPGFAMKHLVKDLTMVSEMGRDLDAQLQSTATALALFQRGMDAGLGEMDMSAAVNAVGRAGDDR